MSTAAFPNIFLPDRRLVLPRRPNVATGWRDRLRGLRNRLFPTKLDAQGRFVGAGGRVVGATGQKAGDTADCDQCPCGSGSGANGCFGCTGEVWPHGGNFIVTLDGFVTCYSDGCQAGTGLDGYGAWVNQVNMDINGTYCVPGGTSPQCGGQFDIPIDFRFSYESADCGGTFFGQLDSVTFYVVTSALGIEQRIAGITNVAAGKGGFSGLVFLSDPLDEAGVCYNGHTFDNLITDCSATAGPTAESARLLHGGTVTISYTASPC